MQQKPHDLNDQNFRPNWINFVRTPIERLASLFYYSKCPHKERPGEFLKRIEKEVKVNNESTKEEKHHHNKRSLHRVTN